MPRFFHPKTQGFMALSLLLSMTALGGCFQMSYDALSISDSHASSPQDTATPLPDCYVAEDLTPCGGDVKDCQENETCTAAAHKAGNKCFPDIPCGFQFGDCAEGYQCADAILQGAGNCIPAACVEPDPTGGTTQNTPTSGDTDHLPTSGDSNNTTPTSDSLPTSGTTDGSTDTGNMTTGVSDSTTGDPCSPISCEMLENGTPDGSGYKPDCDKQKGPTQLQLQAMYGLYFNAQVPTLDQCFGQSSMQDPEGFGKWLFSKYLITYPGEVGTLIPADSCFDSYLNAFNPTLPLWALDLSQPAECDVGWGQTKQVTANYCFSGAPTDGVHISQLQIVNDIGDGTEPIEGGYLKSADLFCDPAFQTGFLNQLLIGGGEVQMDTDCHTLNGVAGKGRIQIDLNGDGGIPNDPSSQFRLMVIGGPGLNVVGDLEQQVCQLI